MLQVKYLALKIENKTLLQSVNIYVELLQVRHPFQDPFEGGLPFGCHSTLLFVTRCVLSWRFPPELKETTRRAFPLWCTEIFTWVQIVGVEQLHETVCYYEIINRTDWIGAVWFVQWALRAMPKDWELRGCRPLWFDIRNFSAFNIHVCYRKLFQKLLFLLML